MFVKTYDLDFIDCTPAEKTKTYFSEIYSRSCTTKIMYNNVKYCLVRVKNFYLNNYIADEMTQSQLADIYL